MQQHPYFAVGNPITTEYIKVEGFVILINQLHLSFNGHAATAILRTKFAPWKVLKGSGGGEGNTEMFLLPQGRNDL